VIVRRLWIPLVVVVACTVVPATAGAEPFVSRTCNDTQICDGWFTGPVSLKWTYAGSPTAGCLNETITQDTAGNLRSCFVSDAGETASKSVTIKLDQTSPIIAGVVPDRPPDHSGWYTHAVTFTAQASDVTSGLAGCDAASYSGPDAANATVVTNCKDKAGNSSSRAFPLSYDATPPDPSSAAIKTGDRVVRLAWPAGATASVTRTPGTDGSTSSVVYEGAGTGFTDREVRNSRRYRYVLTLADQAGNAASRELSAKPQRKLLAPARGATLAAPPLLTWTPVRDARYYNVQLFRNGRKILSAWPTHAALQLKRKWRFHGERYRLKPAEYRWHVWPGEGRRKAHRYGERIGGRSFTLLPAGT
jgi:hypothetical protein